MNPKTREQNVSDCILRPYLKTKKNKENKKPTEQIENKAKQTQKWNDRN